MGLGSRTARQHHTAASERTAGVDPSAFWQFQPGQPVMTVDGFSGKVTAINDGPHSGSESYEVVLDGGLGGGEYTASQLSVKATPAVKTAADDYPELAEILVDRPDIAPNTKWASMGTTAGRDYEDVGGNVEQCPECSEMVNTHTGSMSDHLRDEHDANPDDYDRSDANSAWEKVSSFRDGHGEHDHSRPKGEHGIESFDELEPNDGTEADVDEHGHLSWGGAAPACRDTDEYSMFGQNDAVEKSAAFYTADELRQVGQAEADRQGKSAEEILSAQAAGDWTDAQKRHGDDVARTATPCASCGGSDHSYDQHPAWAEQKHSEGTHDAWGRPKMQAYDGHGAWSCNDYDCAEHPQSLYPQDGQMQGTPGWLSHDAGPDADARRQVNQAMSPEQTQDANWLLKQQHDGPTHLSALLPQDHGEHGPWNLHGQCKQCGHTPHTEADDECDDAHCQSTGFEDGWHTKGEHMTPAHLDPYSDQNMDVKRHLEEAFGGADHKDAEWLLGQQSQGPTHLSSYTAQDFANNVIATYEALRAGEPWDPWGIVTTAASDSDFRFEVTAAWSDVRNKAKRIRSQGGVHVTLATEGVIVAEVKGDTNVYEAGIQRMPGRTAVQGWSCGCKWGAYHWGAEDDFSRFAGRMCSHALALQYEAQSRGMFGRDVRSDDAKPSWTKRMVVVKHDIDGRRDVEAPATKVGSLDTVLATFITRARGSEHPDEVALAFTAAGLDFQAALRSEAAVNDAWGEPAPAPSRYTPGPTKPNDPNENPASAGWASAPEPAGWGEAGPSGLTHMVSSLDDAIFEPELGKEAFLPLLVPLAGGAAGAGAAGAGAAGVGAGAAGMTLLRTLGPKILEKGLQQQVIKGLIPGGGDDEEKRPEGPQGPQANPAPTGEHPVDDNVNNPLNYGARAELNDEPEGALPTTDGDARDPRDPSGLEPDSLSLAATGGIADIVAQFQATAGAQGLQGGASGPAAAASDGLDIAAAARAFLETGETQPMQAMALKAFTPAEQQRIINEGENVRAANLDRLDLTGTHYEPLEAALAAADNDEEWMS